MMKLSLAVVATLMLAGCAYGSNSTTIEPEIQASKSAIGRGAEIALTVTDRRDDKTIGFRSDAYGNTQVIKTEQSIEALVHDTLSDAFVAQGFSVVSPMQASSRNLLAVEILQIENNSNTEIVTSKIHTKVTIKAIATDGRTTYTRSYWAEKDGRNVSTSSASRNERYISETLSVALDQLASDEKLVRLFATRP